MKLWPDWQECKVQMAEFFQLSFLNKSIADLQYCVSDVQQWFSFVHTHTHTFFPDCHHRLLQNTEYSFLHYTVNPSYLFYI